MKPEVLPIPAAACTHDQAREAAPASGEKDIRIIRTFFLRGPGIWTYRPMLEAWVDIGELEDFPSHTLPGFNDRLVAWLPTLIEHHCGVGHRGGFLERLRDGTWSAHILEHVMIELQNLAGIPTGFGKAREMSQRGLYKVVVRTPHEATGRAALFAARELLLAAIHDRAFDVGAAVAQLRAVAAACALDAATAHIVQAAENRRIPVIRPNGGSLVQLGYGAKQRRVLDGTVAGTGAIAQGIADDWELACELLRPAGVPVLPRQELDDDEDVWEAAQDIGLPVMLRPAAGGGTSGPLAERAEIEAACAGLRAHGAQVVIEPHLAGRRYRLLVVGGRVAAACDEDAPDIDLAECLHPELAALATLAARVVDLDIAGVDLLAQDLALPPGAQSVALTGFALRPALTAQGAAAIVDHLYPEAAHSRIPVVGITGSHGKTAIARLLAHLLGSNGMRTGLACSDGLFVGQRRIAAGDCADWEGAQRVLRNPAIDVAVVENGHRNIVAEGLGYDRCKVGVVTGIGHGDLLPEYDINDAERMVSVIRTQVDVVLPDGAAVLNAADSRVAELAPLCDGEVIFYGPATLPVIAAHRERGGRALCLNAGRLEFAHGSDSACFTLPHAVASMQETVLAAAGAAWACGMPAQAIAAALQTFDPAAASAVRLPDLVQAWSRHRTVQSRKSIHGNHADQVVARPQSLELAHACGSDAALPGI